MALFAFRHLQMRGEEVEYSAARDYERVSGIWTV